VKQEPDTFNTAVKAMNAKFEAREYRNPDEFLHVAMLRLWLCEIGVDCVSMEQRIAEIKDTITALTEADQWQEQLPGKSYTVGTQGAYGHSFQFEDRALFQEIRKCVQSGLNHAYRKNFAVWANELMRLIDDDVLLFATRISWTNYSGESFISEAVLAEIKPETFVQKLLSKSVSAQHIILEALKGRYAHHALESRLSDEKDWFIKIRAILVSEQNNRTGILRAQLQVFDRWYFAPLLDDTN
jgi:hypothetical protein